MNKDKIWENIKNDKTEIYDGHSMLDMFLATTERLELKHFLELSPNDRNKINGNVVYELLIYSKNPIEMAQELGQNNINKLDNYHIYDLLLNSENPIEMAQALGQEIINKLKDYDIYHLLHYSKNPIELAQALGQNNLNKLSDEQKKELGLIEK